MGAFKNFLLNFNAFESSHFFRFNRNHKYSNVLGGVCTVILIIAVLVLLIFKVVAVFKNPTVFVSATTEFQLDIVNTTLTPSQPENPFLLAYQISRTFGAQNVSSFKSSLILYTLNSSNAYTVLQQCTPQHWSSAPQLYQEVLNSVAGNSILFCLPLNFSHQMSISMESLLTINVAYQCGSNCSSIDRTEMLIRPIILDTLVNPHERKDYLRNFLEKRQYYPVSTQTAGIDTVLNYQISKYRIQTDNSVLPFEKMEIKQGFFMPSQPTSTSIVNRYPNFVFFRNFFLLTNEEYHYSRSFSKLLDAIAEIGGLLPIFLVFFIWLNYYALYEFEMVFLRRMHSDHQTKQYGILFFFSTLVQRILNFFGIRLDSWQKTKEFQDKHKKVNQFLDILYLHKRLEFIERALSVIFEDHQLQALHLMRNKTFNEATAHLHRYSMKENLTHFIEVRKMKEARRKSRIESRPAIILEPQLTSNEGILSLNTQKNLLSSKQFEGQVREEGIKGSQIIQGEKVSIEQEIRPEDLVSESEDSEGPDEQTIREEMEDLKYVFFSFERIRQEAENSQSNHFNKMSRNIIKKLNDQDWELIASLENFLNFGQKQQIMKEIRNFLVSQTFREEDEIFKKPILEIKQSYPAPVIQKNDLKKSISLRKQLLKVDDKKKEKMEEEKRE